MPKMPWLAISIKMRRKTMKTISCIAKKCGLALIIALFISVT
jgi:hypothetical protein